MDRNRALDDLSSIRRIMDRTQQSLGGHGGWFVFIAGVMWLVGFTGNQFLPEKYAGWTWAVVNTGGMIAMVWAGIRLKKTSGISTPFWKPIFFYWLVMAVFAVLLGWLFDVKDSNQIGLLALFIAALGYVQIGLFFSSRLIGITGVLIAVLAIGAFFLVPSYFALAMAILGGGLLIGSGMRMIRLGK
jgi:hypothetical protein